ncbi:hypothetical protein PLICRDRAFT_180416 [Plicaturopsis crispa FD-325 SS-3]|uniref:Ubiquitin-like protease family profile domain-containing protein n=1 Tax=Plicaturopsis crispa FD-325 SS-3 TaxID=944288 RepID=A0A0C9T2L1_PLICR|nr:hypothetical protein PLICRDRAFT_180416 [Plicaturopsis crispa FD-325 SS-3]
MPNVLCEDPTAPESIVSLVTIHRPVLFPASQLHSKSLRTTFDDAWLSGRSPYSSPMLDKWAQASDWLDRVAVASLGDDRTTDLIEECRSSSLDKAISSDHVDIVEVPVNPAGHWAGARVDLGHNTIAYCDGYNPTATASLNDVALLEWFLSTLHSDIASTSLVDIGAIRMPQQHDGNSCGVVYLSTLTSEYISVTLLGVKRHMRRSIWWFLCLSEGDTATPQQCFEDTNSDSSSLEDNGQTPWLRFAKGAAAGVYKSQEVVLGMAEAMVLKTERLLKGKSLRNMSGALDTFCSMLASISPRAYKTFQNQFGGRGIRSIRHGSNLDSRATISGSQSRAYEISIIIALLVYLGTIGISRLSRSGKSRRRRGLSLEPRMGLQARLDKAKKLRIWVLTIPLPLPKIPPILLAAVARDGKESTEALAEMHFSMMHDENLHATSFAADGTEAERALQQIVAAHAHSVCHYQIPNSVPGCSLNFDVPLFYDHPVINTQDSKHARKTGRNQPQSGARTLTIGNFPIHFAMLRDIIEHPLGPLFLRDVERGDI